MSTLVVVAGGLSFVIGTLTLLVDNEASGRIRRWARAWESRWGVPIPVAAAVLVALGIVLLCYWIGYRDYLP
jgi:hypothetical protein